MALDFTKLEASVAAQAAQTAAVAVSAQHAIDLLNQISAQLKAISGASTDPATQAELDKVTGEIDTSTLGLTATVAAVDAAVVADTPATPPTA